MLCLRAETEWTLAMQLKPTQSRLTGMNHALSWPGFFSSRVAQWFEGRAHFFIEQFWLFPSSEMADFGGFMEVVQRRTRLP